MAYTSVNASVVPTKTMTTIKIAVSTGLVLLVRFSDSNENTDKTFKHSFEKGIWNLKKQTGGFKDLFESSLRKRQ